MRFPSSADALWIPIEAAALDQDAADLPSSALQKARLAALQSSKGLSRWGLRSKGRSSWHVADRNTSAGRSLCFCFDQTSAPIASYSHHLCSLWCAAYWTTWCMFAFCVLWAASHMTLTPLTTNHVYSALFLTCFECILNSVNFFSISSEHEFPLNSLQHEKQFAEPSNFILRWLILTVNWCISANFNDCFTVGKQSSTWLIHNFLHCANCLLLAMVTQK